MTDLNTALTLLANDLGLPPDDLIAYAAEDVLGGYHTDPAAQTFPIGSMWGVEGQLLYAAVRALRPANVVEIGVKFGCSTTHILAALAANGKGKLTSFDTWEGAGEYVPADLRDRWTLRHEDATQFTGKLKADICLEDGWHTRESTEAGVAKLLTLKPRLLLSHDAEHYVVGADVKAAWDEVIGAGNYRTALIAPADCGFAWRVAP